MGVCTSDPLGYLIREYGADVCKYIVSLKSEQFLDQNSPKFIERVQEQFRNAANKFDSQFDNKQSLIQQNFTSTVSDIKKSNPGTLQNAARSQNKSQQQLLGYNSIKAQFNKLKSQKDEKLKEQEGGLVRVVEQQKQNLKREIVNARPSLPLFDKMPVCLRQMVLSQGQQKFAPQIKQGQEKILSIFEGATNMNNLQDTIRRAAGLDSADRLVKDSKSTFDKAKRALTFAANPRSCFG